MSSIDDLSPSDSAMTIGKLRAWGEVHSKKYGDGDGNIVAGVDLVAVPGKVASLEAAMDAKADLVDGTVPVEQLPAGAGGEVVESVNGKSGVVTLGLKDFEDIQEAIEKKADLSSLEGYATTVQLGTKADASSLAKYATVAALNNGLAAKADVSSLSGYATADALAVTNSALATKAPLASPALTGTATLNGKAVAIVDMVEEVKRTGGALVGEIRLLPFRATELPDGWYFCNGGGFLVTSAQGQVMNSLSDTFKSDWGISTSGTTIYLPNLFTGSDGYFLRPVNNAARFPGNKQADAIRNFTGTINDIILPASTTVKASGVFTMTSASSAHIGFGTYNGARVSSITLTASRSLTTATENRPINVGMTPAIFLGVSS